MRNQAEIKSKIEELNAKRLSLWEMTMWLPANNAMAPYERLEAAAKLAAYEATVAYLEWVLDGPEKPIPLTSWPQRPNS